MGGTTAVLSTGKRGGELTKEDFDDLLKQHLEAVGEFFHLPRPWLDSSETAARPKFTRQLHSSSLDFS
jgi:hypothetical protein